MSADLPSRRQFEYWCRQLQADIDWLYDTESGRSGPYRWALSGLDGLRSKSLDGTRGGRVWHVEADQHGDEENIAATAVEDAAAARRVAQITRAAGKVRQASVLLGQARHALTERDGRESLRVVKQMWNGNSDTQRLYELQAQREARGEGWGDG